MKNRKKRSKIPGLLAALGITLALLITASLTIDTMTGDIIYGRLVKPLFRLVMFISLGLMIGQLIEASGWTRYLAAVAAPLFRFGNMGVQCSAAFTTAFLSGTVANAMLVDFYKEGRICKNQLFLANLTNQLPAYFLHLPTTVFIVIPLTGTAGIIYFTITFTAVVLRTILLLTYGHYKLPGSTCAMPLADGTYDPKAPSKRTSAREGVTRRFPKRLMGVLTFVIPIYTLVFVLNTMGLFNILRDILARFVVTRVVPVESLSVVVLSFVAEFTSGFAAAGALLDAGVLTVKQTVLALIIGNITAFPVRALRHQLPRYMGIFEPKMGGQLLLLGQGFRVASIILVTVIYATVA
ncbi:MAG: nucleoside recognition protein [Desulfobacteraceae bacterium]|nr:nucleoside recognition protein [Desulfobacteraceae bacterium]